MPQSFFVGRTEGHGVVHEISGRQRRCRILTQGVADPGRDAVQFNETFDYEDGVSDPWRWVIARGADGRYVASESLAGPGLMGRIENGDYVLSFRRPLRPGAGFPKPRFRTRFTLLAPDTALKRVRISLFGVPVATLTAFHKRVG